MAAAVLASLTLPSCGTGPCGEGLGIDNTLASAEGWVRVSSLPDDPDAEGTVEMNLDVVPVDEHGDEGSPRVEALNVHTSFLPDIEQGLNEQADVFLALDVRRIKPEFVLYVVVQGADGSHHIPGQCLSEGEEFLRQRLNGTYDAAIDAMIGSTDSKRIATLLESP